MDGLRLHGAWIDEVHGLPEIPKPSKPFNFRTIYDTDTSSSAATEAIDAMMRRILEFQASLPPGYELVLQETVPRFECGIDENSYSMTYEVRPIIRPREF